VKYYKTSFIIKNIKEFKQQMLSWGNQFNICCFLDNHQYQNNPTNTECLLAVNPVKEIKVQNNYLDALTNFIQSNSGEWFFGHVSFNLKQEIYGIHSTKINQVNFAPLYFFIPEIVVELKQQKLTIYSKHNNTDTIFSDILNINFKKKDTNTNASSFLIKPKISKEEYIKCIHQLKQHIQRGDCYEINFCQEFFAKDVAINTKEVYKKLTTLSATPFACYYKLNEQYLLCASPERFVCKNGNKIISQPIKGTIKRNLKDSLQDDVLKKQLQNSSKDKTENVMIVDLVRNDLSKICTKGSVIVEELFGVYSFPQVHQMISTVSGNVQKNINFSEVLQATFPMGSMTGAPKKRVLELTEQYEKSNRGIYSGTVGYITPENNFDFNVVIRSIMYNAVNKYLSYMVGGGITINSNAEDEYQECLLKATAIKEVLT